MKCFWIISFIFTLLFCHTPHASITRDFISPYNTDARTPFLIGVGITTLAAILEDQLVDPFQEETVDDKPLGKASPIGDYAGQLIPNVIYTVTMFSINKTKKAQHMLKATLYSGLVTTALKYTIREPRPNTDNRESFPSGHTTSAFAFASTVATEHSLFWGVAAYSLAGLVAYSRINDNAHYLHDVLGGATIGIGYGLGIYFEQKHLIDDDSFFAILPAKDMKGAFVSLHSRY